MVDTSFFDESRDQSRIKSRILAKYFWAWARVIIPTAKAHDNRIAYIDLFAGPGRYNDGDLLPEN
jgi:three-Cys-motif partner protein